MAKKPPGEVVQRNLSTKVVYHFVDPENDVNVLSREDYKKRDRVVHYPFNPRNGSQRYKKVNKITYDGVGDPLPAGFLKAANRGYGFTRELAPLLYLLEETFPKLQHLVVSSSDKSAVRSQTEIVLSLDDLQAARPRIKTLLTRHGDEKSNLANNILATLLPKSFKSQKAKYSKGQLGEFLKSHSLKSSQLSDDEIRGITEILATLPSTHRLIKSGEILATKRSFDRVFLEDLITRFEKLLQLKNDSRSLESKWQDFFSKNILYFNFGYVERFEKERIKGDKSLNIPDFVMLNTFNYLDVFEIKTH